MNDEVEEKFLQMFAPNEIPVAVIELYQRVQFFVSRLDLPGMKLSQLCLIAAVATGGAPQAVPAKPPTDEDVDTSEPDADVADPEPQTPVAEQPAPEQAVGGDQAPAATGPMDAPATVKYLSVREKRLHLHKLELPELRVHAKEFYGFDGKNLNKRTIIDALMKQAPDKVR